jgi:integrase
MSDHTLTQHRGKWAIRYIRRDDEGNVVLDSNGKPSRGCDSTGIPVGDEESKQEAQKFLINWLAGRRAADQQALITVEETTIGAVCKMYLAHCEKENTALATQYKLRNVRDSDMAGFDVRTVSARMFEDYVDARVEEGDVSEYSALWELRCLRTAIRHAYESHPALMGLTRPLVKETDEQKAILQRVREVHLDDWEQPDYIEAAKAHSAYIHQFTMIALFTAARLESIRMLCWSRVDWISGRINFKYPGEIETRKKRAIVKIHSMLLPVLREMWIRQGRPRTGLVLYPGLFYPTGGKTHKERAALRRAAYLKLPCFADKWRRFRATTARADVSPHALRRSCAVRMFRSGASTRQVAMVLADSEETVRKHYAPFIRSEADEAIEMMRSPEEMERDRRLMMGENNVVAFGGR